MKMGNQSTCFPGQNSMWIPREFLLELGSGIRQLFGEGG